MTSAEKDQIVGTLEDVLSLLVEINNPVTARLRYKVEKSLATLAAEK